MAQSTFQTCIALTLIITTTTSSYPLTVYYSNPTTGQHLTRSSPPFNHRGPVLRDHSTTGGDRDNRIDPGGGGWRPIVFPVRAITTVPSTTQNETGNDIVPRITNRTANSEASYIDAVDRRLRRTLEEFAERFGRMLEASAKRLVPRHVAHETTTTSTPPPTTTPKTPQVTSGRKQTPEANRKRHIAEDDTSSRSYPYPYPSHRPLLGYNSAEHAPPDPYIALFLSHYGRYLPGGHGVAGNYRNLYSYLAANNIHNNMPFGSYKIYEDADG